jgi:hypothetical protein
LSYSHYCHIRIQSGILALIDGRGAKSTSKKGTSKTRADHCY